MFHKQEKKYNNSSVRAFTQLCTNVNISIFANTMTIYIKLNGVTLSDNDPRAQEAKKNLDEAWPKLGEKYAIYHYDAEHKLLHQDGMERDDWHTHIKFIQPLDEKKLTQVLDEFVDTQVISSKERKQFIHGFKQANQLPRYDWELLMAKNALEELQKSVTKNVWFSNNSKLNANMTTVLQHFKRLINEGNHLADIQKYIKETQLVVRKPTQENISKLQEMALKVENSPSIIWQALGAALMALGVALNTAAVVIATGSAGIGLTTALGLTLSGLGVFALGARYIYPDTKPLLSKELTNLSEQMTVQYSSTLQDESSTFSY